MTATRAEKYPYSRNSEPIRVWGISWTDLNSTARGIGTARATIAGDAAEALNNWMLCEKCKRPVPLIWGDLTGTDLAHALTAAITARLRQNCKAGHTPVLVGAETGSQPQASSGTAGQAATRGEGAQGRTEPREAVPAGRAQEWRDYAVARSDESVARARSLAGAPAVPFMAGPDVDCAHEGLRTVKGACPDCKQWVKP